ncbi:MAG: DUF3373 family protein [Campylobacterales bacterium]
MRLNSKILYSTIFLSTLSFGLSEDDIVKRLDALEKQVSELQKENSELKGTLQKQNKESIEDELWGIHDRIDSVETMTLLDRVHLGLGFTQRVDNFSKKYADGTKVNDNNIWTTKFNLNMDSKITDDMKFTGRLSMYKYWADSDPNSLSYRDSTEGRKPSSSALWVERAYVDWRLFDGEVPTYLTLGRQPSSDGLSYQYKDNTVRKSTYSALAFDGAVDGIVLTSNFEKPTGMDNAALRLAYGKAFQSHRNYQYSGVSNYTGADIKTSTGTTLKDSNVYGVFADGSIPGIEGTLWQGYYVSALDIPGTDMGMGNTGANADGFNQNIGDFSIIGGLVESTNIYDSGLDAFFQYAYSKADPNGKVWMAPDGNGYGLMTNTLGDTSAKTGDALWAGVRYSLPFIDGGKIGYEYNQGSKYWLNFGSGSNDLTNKLATKGSANEVYYIQDINRYAFLRVGGVFIDYDYSNSGDYRGEPIKISDLSATQKPMVADNLTNVYLLFSILY